MVHLYPSGYLGFFEALLCRLYRVATSPRYKLAHCCHDVTP